REGEIGNFFTTALNLSGSSGNEERENINFSFAANRNTNDVESLVYLNFQERTKNQQIEDEANFFHARLLFKSREVFNWEIYTQYSENPFQLYKKRALIGAGARFKLPNDKRLGISILNEKETSLINNEEVTTDRFNFYYTDSISLNENINFNYSIFFQPSIKEFSNDYKLSSLLQIEFFINERVSINFNVSRTEDTDPPILASESDTAYATEFRLSL
ncbi:MAG: DUF481 domain-containing protein, partial [Proteobacteria bacterium]|nr:DUF481 domain-containing protein [Pseudomonadota bacterium]